MRYVEQFFLGFDQWVNTWFGGYADESLSARCWRMNKKHRYGKWKWCRLTIDALFRWQMKYHCCYAYRSEVKRRQLPKDYQQKGNSNA